MALLQFDVHRRDEEDVVTEQGHSISPEWTRLVKLAILGDVLQDQRFSNAVIDTVIDRANAKRHYPAGMAETVYTKLPKDSGLRRLLVDFYAYIHNGNSLTGTSVDAMHAPKEFWKDVLCTTFKAGAKIYAGGPKPWETDKCQYHEHPEGEGKCGAK